MHRQCVQHLGALPGGRLPHRRGKLGGYTKLGASGRSLTRHFCRDCGSPIYTSSPRDETVVFIKAGAFDDPGVVTPGLEAWMRSKVSWATIPADLPQFEEGRGSAAAKN